MIIQNLLEEKIYLTFLLSLFSIHTLSKYLFKYSDLATWYLIHSIGNIFITYYCLEPIYHLLGDPIFHMMNPTDFHITMVLIIILHTYHMLFFKCTNDDIFHHITFVGIGSLVVYFYKNGYFLALSNFFICGLPGAIDYFFLFLYKISYIDKNTRLKEAVFVNLWIRSTGLNLVACFALMNFIYKEKNIINIFGLCLQLMMTVGNGNMYLRDIIYSAGKKQIYNN